MVMDVPSTSAESSRDRETSRDPSIPANTEPGSSSTLTSTITDQSTQFRQSSSALGVNSNEDDDSDSLLPDVLPNIMVSVNVEKIKGIVLSVFIYSFLVLVSTAPPKKPKKHIGPAKKRGRPRKNIQKKPKVVVKPFTNDGGSEGSCPRSCGWNNCEHVAPSVKDLKQHIDQDHLPFMNTFKCEWSSCCRKEPFKALYMLSIHLRRHTGERPHTCTFPYCSKTYSRLENLRTHMRHHTGEKPYSCLVAGCYKSFSNASDRAKHQSRTHGETVSVITYIVLVIELSLIDILFQKKYSCTVDGCEKKYTDPSSLRKHIIVVHGQSAYNLIRLNKSNVTETPVETEN